MTAVLIVDDQAGMRRTLQLMLEKEGYVVDTAASAGEAAERLALRRPEIVITDLKLDPGSGIDVLRRVKQDSPSIPVIIMTAYGTIESAVDAMKLGASDFITKPFRSAEIVLKIGKALEGRDTAGQARRAPERGQGKHWFSGTSRAMSEIAAQVEQVGGTLLTVLITGETGVGKSHLARLLHARSPHASGRFVSVNVAAVAEPLLESELFGHERGAFTGAVQARRGLIEEAHRGTFFLDEIGALPATLQSKLLGVLQDREVRRVGANRTQPVEMRVIAATNAQLEQAVARGEFRQDLYHRLNVARIHIPPLRERLADVPVLAQGLLCELSRRQGRQHTLSAAALQLLCDYDYPGNIRELENALEWAAAMAHEGEILPRHLPAGLQAGRAQRACGITAGTLSDLERQSIVDSLARHQGNLAETARALGIGRTTLWRKMREYGIRR